MKLLGDLGSKRILRLFVIVCFYSVSCQIECFGCEYHIARNDVSSRLFSPLHMISRELLDQIAVLT